MNLLPNLLSLWRDRYINKGFKQLEATSRASTKLSPGYEKRRVREIRRARAKFEPIEIQQGELP